MKLLSFIITIIYSTQSTSKFVLGQALSNGESPLARLRGEIATGGKSQATRTILVDMDATIADYVGHFVANYNILFKTDIMNGEKPFLAVDSGPNAMTDYYFYSGHEGHFRCYEENRFAEHDINDNKYTPCSLTDPDFYQVVLTPGFFEGIPPMDGAVEALRELQATPGISVKIVTFPEPEAWDRTIQEKRTWLTTHLGPEWATDDVARFVDGVDKCTVRGDILIDDREKPSKGNEVFCQTKTCSANGQNLPRPKEGWSAEACQAYGVKHQVETIFTNFNDPTSWKHVIYSAPYNLHQRSIPHHSAAAQTVGRVREQFGANGYTVARLDNWSRGDWTTVLGGIDSEFKTLINSIPAGGQLVEYGTLPSFRKAKLPITAAEKYLQAIQDHLLLWLVLLLLSSAVYGMA